MFSLRKNGEIVEGFFFRGGGGVFLVRNVAKVNPITLICHNSVTTQNNIVFLRETFNLLAPELFF